MRSNFLSTMMKFPHEEGHGKKLSIFSWTTLRDSMSNLHRRAWSMIPRLCRKVKTWGEIVPIEHGWARCAASALQEGQNAGKCPALRTASSADTIQLSQKRWLHSELSPYFASP